MFAKCNKSKYKKTRFAYKVPAMRKKERREGKGEGERKGGRGEGRKEQSQKSRSAPSLISYFNSRG